MEESKSKCGRKRIYKTEEEKKKASSLAQSRLRSKKLYNHLKELCELRNATLLSEEYISAFTPLKIKCAFGHEFEVCSNHIKTKNTWCKICDEEMKNIVLNKNEENINLPVNKLLYIIIQQKFPKKKITDKSKGGRPRKYATEEEAREAKRRIDRKYYQKNRERKLEKSKNYYYKNKYYEEIISDD